ncbi:MAG: hypothetical protein WCA08_06965, partial [Desulfoferrobacter sp.]
MEFASKKSIAAVLFQGGNVTDDGGWFENSRVELLQGDGWNSIGKSSLEITARKKNDAFATTLVRFPEAKAYGVRVIGKPGGSARFVSVGEIRVFGLVNEPFFHRSFPAARDQGLSLL